MSWSKSQSPALCANNHSTTKVTVARSTATFGFDPVKVNTSIAWSIRLHCRLAVAKFFPRQGPDHADLGGFGRLRHSIGNTAFAYKSLESNNCFAAPKCSIMGCSPG